MTSDDCNTLIGPHPDQLLNNIKKSGCVLLLSVNLSLGCEDAPFRVELAHEMARRYRLDESLSLAEVAHRIRQAGRIDAICD